jgi:hypothetical protein
MQWVKQTFAVRFNLRRGRTGHVWGDRYWSRVVEEPPEGVVEVDWVAVEVAAKTGVLSSGTCLPDGDSPRWRKTRWKTDFRPKTSPDTRHCPANPLNSAQNRAESPAQTSSIPPSNNGPG